MTAHAHKRARALGQRPTLPRNVAAPSRRGAILLLGAAIALALLAVAGLTLLRQLRELGRFAQPSHGGRAS